jgi:hypothetical protein
MWGGPQLRRTDRAPLWLTLRHSMKRGYPTTSFSFVTNGTMRRLPSPRPLPRCGPSTASTSVLGASGSCGRNSKVRRTEPLPTVLSREEVARLLSSVRSDRFSF